MSLFHFEWFFSPIKQTSYNVEQSSHLKRPQRITYQKTITGFNVAPFIRIAYIDGHWKNIKTKCDNSRKKFSENRMTFEKSLSNGLKKVPFDRFQFSEIASHKVENKIWEMTFDDLKNINCPERGSKHFNLLWLPWEMAILLALVIDFH